MDLSNVKAVGLDETASKRGHNYVTVFMDMDSPKKPVLFATEGKGTEAVAEFGQFMEDHGGQRDNITEAVSDMSPAFLAGVREQLPQANVTVDWFHVVQLFSKSLDEVRKHERKVTKQHPKALRWAVLNSGGPFTSEGLPK